MQINVYSQELTKEVTIVEKTSDNGITHHGIRLYMASPDVLHNTPDDDDRSAVTFWIPDCGSFTATDLATVFIAMASKATHVGGLRKARK